MGAGTDLEKIEVGGGVSGIDRHHDRTSDCRYRVVESSSLVSVLLSEVFSHPNIFFHLLVIVEWLSDGADKTVKL